MHERLTVRVFEEWRLLGHHTGATPKEKKIKENKIKEKKKKSKTRPGEKKDNKRKYTAYMKQSTREEK